MGRPAVVAFSVYSLAAVARTWPLIRFMGSHISPDPGDPFLNAWILAWGARALATSPASLFDANIFYPVERTLAQSEHLLGVQVIFAPVYAITGNLVAGYNTVFLLSFVLSSQAAFGLSYYLTRAFWPSLVAGALFGFAPFRLSELSHLQLLNLFWAPAAFVFLDLFLRRPRWGTLTGFALFYWLQALSSAYLGYMMTIGVVAYAGALAITTDRQVWSRGALGKAGVCVGASAVVLGLVYWPYVQVQRQWGLSRSLQDIKLFTPDVLSFLAAPQLMNHWYTAALQDFERWGWKRAPALPRLGAAGPHRDRCVGDSARARLPACAPYARRFRRRHRERPCAISGSVLERARVRHRASSPIPRAVPHCSGLRQHEGTRRFVLLALLGASPLTALGLMRVMHAVAAWLPGGGRTKLLSRAAGATVLGLFFVELGTAQVRLVQAPVADRIPSVYRWLARERPGPILEIPMGPTSTPTGCARTMACSMTIATCSSAPCLAPPGERQ